MSDASYPFTPPSRSWWRAARFTPLWDLVRGEFSYRLDARQWVADAKLPAPLPGLIMRVVKRSRLGRHERVDVARELIEHFVDGLAAGSTPQQVVDSFGPPRQAARLIRRAKLRNRSIVWKSWWFVSRTAMLVAIGLLIAYVFWSIQYFRDRPQIKRNFVAEMNCSQREIPHTQRSWPSYRAARMRLGKLPDDVHADSVRVDLANFTPAHARWNVMRTFLADHEDVMQEVRHAATLPHLGLILGDREDEAAIRTTPGAADAGFWPIAANLLEEANPPVESMYPIQQWGAIRDLGWVLGADAVIAADQGDWARWKKDCTAMIQIAEQLFGAQGTWTNEFFGLAAFEEALEAVAAGIDHRRRAWLQSLIALTNESPDDFALPVSLASSSALAPDDALRMLAHQLAGFGGGGRITIDFHAAWPMIGDFLQRGYSDDGRGGGHITSEGLHAMLFDAAQTNSALKGLYLATDRDGKSSDTFWKSLIPLAAASVVGRAESERLAREYIAYCEELSRRNPWDITYESLAGPMLPDHGYNGSWRHRALIMTLPSAGLILYANNVSLERDAILAALAIELYYRDHHAWPQSLADLVPKYLPAVPLDFYDGHPLGYKLQRDWPVLYSVATDKYDDGGAPLSDKDFWQGSPIMGRDPVPQGDWVLWPPRLLPQARR